MKFYAPPKNPLKGLVPVALDAAAAASLTLSGTRSLAPLAASFTLAAASEGLGATSSTLFLAAVRRRVLFGHLTCTFDPYYCICTCISRPKEAH